MASPIDIILEMIHVIIEETLRVTFRLLSLYGELFQAVGVSSTVGGPLGFFVSIALLVGVGFVIGKMALGGGKKLIGLVILGLFLTFIALAGLFS